MRSSASAVMLLPHPLSPMMPSVSPRRSAEVDVGEDPDLASFHPEVDAQVLDPQDDVLRIDHRTPAPAPLLVRMSHRDRAAEAAPGHLRATVHAASD